MTPHSLSRNNMLRTLRLKSFTHSIRQSIRTMSTPSAGVQPGASATAQLRVGQPDLASSISTDPQDSFPDVFTAARLVALMEIASARVLKPMLQPGQLSVGVNIDMTHTAPTPVGAEVTAESTYRGVEEKVHVYQKFWLHDWTALVVPGRERGQGV